MEQGGVEGQMSQRKYLVAVAAVAGVVRVCAATALCAQAACAALRALQTQRLLCTLQATGMAVRRGPDRLPCFWKWPMRLFAWTRMHAPALATHLQPSWRRPAAAAPGAAPALRGCMASACQRRSGERSGLPCRRSSVWLRGWPAATTGQGQGCQSRPDRSKGYSRSVLRPYVRAHAAAKARGYLRRCRLWEWVPGAAVWQF